MGPVSIGVEVQQNTDGDTPSRKYSVIKYILHRMFMPRNAECTNLSTVRICLLSLYNLSGILLEYDQHLYFLAVFSLCALT